MFVFPTRLWASVHSDKSHSFMNTKCLDYAWYIIGLQIILVKWMDEWINERMQLYNINIYSLNHIFTKHFSICTSPTSYKKFVSRRYVTSMFTNCCWFSKAYWIKIKLFGLIFKTALDIIPPILSSFVFCFPLSHSQWNCYTGQFIILHLCPWFLPLHIHTSHLFHLKILYTPSLLENTLFISKANTSMYLPMIWPGKWPAKCDCSFTYTTTHLHLSYLN